MRLRVSARAVAAGTVLFFGFASPTFAESLEGAVRATLKSHPAVAADVARSRAADQQVSIERGPFFPSLDLSTASGYENTFSPTTRGRATRPPGSSGSVVLFRNEARFTVTQLVFDGLETVSRVDSALSAAVGAAYRAQNTARVTALRAVGAYIDVLRNKEFVRLATDNLRLHREILAGIRRLSRQGRSRGTDVVQARARVSLAEANLESQLGAARESEARYLETVGQKPGAMAPPKIPADVANLTLEDSLKMAGHDNPTVQAAASAVRSSNFSLDATSGPFWPRLEFELGAQKANNLDGTRGSNNDYTALVRLTYNLYRGGADRARRRQALHTLAASRKDESEARRQTREDVRQAYYALVTARDRLKPLRARAQANHEVVNAYNKQFQLGQRSLLDLLDVQNELFVSRLNAVDGEHIYIFNHYRLLSTIGRLLKHFGVKQVAGKAKSQ